MRKIEQALEESRTSVCRCFEIQESRCKKEIHKQGSALMKSSGELNREFLSVVLLRLLREVIRCKEMDALCA